jgi:hypothetical protein
MFGRSHVLAGEPDVVDELSQRIVCVVVDDVVDASVSVCGDSPASPSQPAGSGGGVGVEPLVKVALLLGVLVGGVVVAVAVAGTPDSCCDGSGCPAGSDGGVGMEPLAVVAVLLGVVVGGVAVGGTPDSCCDGSGCPAGSDGANGSGCPAGGVDVEPP